MDKPEAMQIELVTDPLRLLLKTEGRVYRQLLTPAMAQGLALALAANSTPEMARALAELLNARPGLLLPEVAATINLTAAEYAARKRPARPAFLEVN
jgi:hypothetical protein